MARESHSGVDVNLTTSRVFALLRKEPASSRLDELCEFAPAEGAEEDLVLWLLGLVDWLRPRRGKRIDSKIKFLDAQLTQHPEWRARVSASVVRLLDHVDIGRFLAYGGIPSEFHFTGAVYEWLAVRVLPAACKTDDGADIVRLAFEESDLAWLRHSSVIGFFESLVKEPTLIELREAAREAMLDLGHQIVAQAHAPSVRVLEKKDRSPYSGLYEAIAALDAAPADEEAYAALRGRAHQCSLLLHLQRKELTERGASFNTTFQLRRMQEQLRRLTLLARLRHEANSKGLRSAIPKLVADVLHNADGKRLWRRSADLVVQNVVDSAANVGREYLEDEQSTWRAAFLAGAGGGFLMALATIAKYALADLHLREIYEGFFFSLNYAAVFCAAYLLHFTIATKLPAHTAAALVRSAQEGIGHRARLDAFIDVWKSTLRLQIAGLLGNLALAGPAAFAIDSVFARCSHHHILSAEQAHHSLAMNSLLGPSILYAALTGVFLWMSSLIGALASNWVRVVRLSDRFATNVHAMRRIGSARARVYADRIVDRIGGLIGNASLGFMLGGVPAAFAIGSLPVEIRHITVSTSSVALALSSGGETSTALGLALAGLCMIALVNVATSFLLAFWLALHATRGMRASLSANGIVRIGLGRWLRRRPLESR